MIPASLETEIFRQRMLAVEDVERDYEAVMESRVLLQSMFGRIWPREDFTLEENLQDLQRHQQEFLERKAFAYTVVSLDESEVLGCVYINPPEQKIVDTDDPEAVVQLWVRQREYNRGLDEELFSAVKEWLEESGPFEKVAYPGRE